MTWVNGTKYGERFNLDHVASIRMTTGGDSQLFAPDGRSLGVTTDDLDEKLAPLVPAAAGQQVWLVTSFDDGKLEAERRNVVAWKITALDAFPVIAGDAPSSNQFFLAIHPDGSVEQFQGNVWPTIEAAMDDMRRERAARTIKAVP